MKTHNYVFVTLSIKNVIMASPLNDYKVNDKGLMHQAAPARNDLLHYNMFHMGQEVFPDLAVIDGFVGIEGNGPAWGSPIASHVALASRDAVAADITATRVMGFDPRIVNYLNAMAEAGMGQGDYAKIQLVGTPLEQCVTKYKPNETDGGAVQAMRGGPVRAGPPAAVLQKVHFHDLGAVLRGGVDALPGGLPGAGSGRTSRSSSSRSSRSSPSAWARR